MIQKVSSSDNSKNILFDNEGVIMFTAPLDLTKVKKKSKKPPPSFLTETDATADPAKPAGESAPAENGVVGDGNLDFKAMKKKKRPNINLEELGQTEPIAETTDSSKRRTSIQAFRVINCTNQCFCS